MLHHHTLYYLSPWRKLNTIWLRHIPYVPQLIIIQYITTFSNSNFLFINMAWLSSMLILWVGQSHHQIKFHINIKWLKIHDEHKFFSQFQQLNPRMQSNIHMLMLRTQFKFKFSVSFHGIKVLSTFLHIKQKLYHLSKHSSTNMFMFPTHVWVLMMRTCRLSKKEALFCPVQGKKGRFSSMILHALLYLTPGSLANATQSVMKILLLMMMIMLT